RRRVPLQKEHRRQADARANGELLGRLDQKIPHHQHRRRPGRRRLGGLEEHHRPGGKENPARGRRLVRDQRGAPATRYR
nr:hypothetical protein [Tanacetum cinerariifolium]